MSIEDPLHNKYSLVKGAARRARQLQSGAQPMVATTSTKACRVAQDEISEGRVTFVVSHAPKAVVVEPDEPDDEE
jgi:DNA-directed RNA polymerase subunit omega